MSNALRTLDRVLKKLTDDDPKTRLLRSEGYNLAPALYKKLADWVRRRPDYITIELESSSEAAWCRDSDASLTISLLPWHMYIEVGVRDDVQKLTIDICYGADEMRLDGDSLVLTLSSGSCTTEWEVELNYVAPNTERFSAFILGHILLLEPRYRESFVRFCRWLDDKWGLDAVGLALEAYHYLQTEGYA